jgi:hypothetical protein
VSSEKFINQFIDHGRNGAINDFIHFYQLIDVLIIDDVQFFNRAEKSQDAFFSIFNHLHQSGKQLILTSDKPPKDLEGAIVRLILEYPRDWESLIDETALQEHIARAFDFHLVRRPTMETRIRLPGDQAIGSLAPLELLDLYWRASHSNEKDLPSLIKLAGEVIQTAAQDG